MNVDDIKREATKLPGFHDRFAAHFGRRENQANSLTYLKGLLLGSERKNVEAMALQFVERSDDEPLANGVVALQRFITNAKWNSADVQEEIQRAFADELMPSVSKWNVGTIGVIDESSFEKKGDKSVGVDRQWCGRLGKIENCQVGVFLVGVTPAGTAGLDQQLYMGESWAKDKKRRKSAKVPTDIRFKTKPQIATELITRTLANGHVKFDWITADELYGRNGAFLDSLDQIGQRYLVEVPNNTTICDVDKNNEAVKPHKDGIWSVKALTKQLRPHHWKKIKVRDGEKGPLVFKFYRIRVRAIRDGKPGPLVWLIVRQSLGRNPETKWYISNAGDDATLEQMAVVTVTRWRVEEYFEDGKVYLGMADYEARAWSSWHHHMTMVALAHLFATLVKRKLASDTPHVSIDMTFRLLRPVMVSQVTPQEALEITMYYLHNNAKARKSHRKRWLAKFGHLKYGLADEQNE